MVYETYFGFSVEDVMKAKGIPVRKIFGTEEATAYGTYTHMNPANDVDIQTYVFPIQHVRTLAEIEEDEKAGIVDPPPTYKYAFAHIHKSGKAVIHFGVKFGYFLNKPNHLFRERLHNFALTEDSTAYRELDEEPSDLDQVKMKHFFDGGFRWPEGNASSPYEGSWD